jgi:hypothetical protein
VGILRRLFRLRSGGSATHEPAVGSASGSTWNEPTPDPARGSAYDEPAPDSPAAGSCPRPAVVLYGGSHDLEVVGESHYQDALWEAVGGRTTSRVRVDVEAVLFAENDNAYDSNAISVWIRNKRVGYLSRDDAAIYRHGLVALRTHEGKEIGLRAVIVGGGIREDGPGFLGVWLSYNPVDFGETAVVPPPVFSMCGSMRTGLTEALLTDEGDDSYDLSWLQAIPSDPIAAISKLRQLLGHDPDPIDRHFMYCELEERLYRSRDAFSSALAEYDEVCTRHDSEMDDIRGALFVKFGKVPLLDTYRQMAIRQQRAKRWPDAIWWAERGLALYGGNAARPEAVADLENRVTAYRAKLVAGTKSTPRVATRTAKEPTGGVAIEALTCAKCGRSFERLVAPGRKPKHCPSCR